MTDNLLSFLIFFHSSKIIYILSPYLVSSHSKNRLVSYILPYIIPEKIEIGPIMKLSYMTPTSKKVTLVIYTAKYLRHFKVETEMNERQNYFKAFISTYNNYKIIYFFQTNTKNLQLFDTKSNLGFSSSLTAIVENTVETRASASEN